MAEKPRPGVDPAGAFLSPYNVPAMMRLRAVRSLLIDEVAGVASTPSRRWGRSRPEGETPEMPAEERDIYLREELDQASRKALGMVVLCWTAILVLFVTHESPERFFSFRGFETVYTLGVLLVATYSGFRLGQWEKYRAVKRVVEEVEERGGE